MQCYKKADPSTWWGKVLEANIIKASLAAAPRIPAAALCKARFRHQEPPKINNAEPIRNCIRSFHYSLIFDRI